MIKIKLGALSTVSAIILATLSYKTGLFSSVVDIAAGSSSVNEIHMNTHFNNTSADKVSKYIDQVNEDIGSRERLLLEITSGGGSVFAGNSMIADINNSKVPVDTYVTSFAASMGAQTFIQGKRRYVEPSAMVLFHGALMGDYRFTENTLGIMVRYIRSAGFKQEMTKHLKRVSKARAEQIERQAQVPRKVSGDVVHPIIAAADSIKSDPVLETGYVFDKNDGEKAVVHRLVMEMGYNGAKHTVESSYKMIHTINDMGADSLLQILPKGWTLAMVKKVFYGNYSTDMVFTGKQLLKYGIATHAGKPRNMSKTYKKY